MSRLLIACVLLGGCAAMPLAPEAEKAAATWSVEYFLPYPGEIIDDWHVDVDDVAVSGRKAYNIRDAKGVLIDRTWSFSRCMTPERWARAYPDRMQAAMQGKRKLW